MRRGREKKDSLRRGKEKEEEEEKRKREGGEKMSQERGKEEKERVGGAERGREGKEEEEKKEFSNIISTNSDLLLNLINDILDLSKIEAGVLDYKEEWFSLDELFRKFELSFKVRIKSSITFRLIHPDNPISICFDRKRLSQLLNNFLSNAIKYTINGEISFGYDIVDQGVKIYVNDTGIGISEENKAKIFNRFEKVDNFAQGTGLGLSICKAILDYTNGEIGFESELGKGSSFWAYIPCSIIK